MNIDKWYYDYDDERDLWSPVFDSISKFAYARGSKKSGRHIDIDGLEAWISGEEKLFRYITVINDIQKDSVVLPDSYHKGDINLLLGVTE